MLIVLWIVSFITIGITISDGMLGAIVLAGVTAVLVGTGTAIARVRRQSATALTAAGSARAALPGRQSAAREPMKRLAEVETALRDVMAQLSPSTDGPSVPRHVVDDAERVAAETAERLRGIAAKVEAIEAAARHAPTARRAGLEDGARTLLANLEQGLEGYRELIAAAGHLVLAGTQDPVPSELIEATDHLVGFAAALRDLSGGGEFSGLSPK